MDQYENASQGSDHSRLGKNAYPKIEGNIRFLLRALEGLRDKGSLPETITMNGTVKLHGMHADIVFDLNTRAFTFQSRNRACKPNEDNHGWPKKLAQKPAALDYLHDRIVEKFIELNPNQPLDKSLPLIIAGEWIGQRVQKGVAISELQPGFVIFGVKINGEWQKDSDYAMIQANKASIYSIFNVPQYKVTIDTKDLSAYNPAFHEMQRLADEVETKCPFAAHFGVNGKGEGIVWKPDIPEGHRNPKFWIKTKGPTFGSAANRLTMENADARIYKSISVKDAAVQWVTERRVEQGFEYLLEMNIMCVREGEKEFCAWIVDDVLEEERLAIEVLKNSGITDAKKKVRSQVDQLAHQIYSDMK